MAKPDSTELVQQIQIQKFDDYRKSEIAKLRKSYSHLEIEKQLIKLDEYTGNLPEGELRQGIISCFLGALYAFRDRDLDPFHQDHIYIYKIIREDIEQAFSMVNQGILDSEVWKFETFDYGIKHVYYLDWQLYLSKICY